MGRISINSIAYGVRSRLSASQKPVSHNLASLSAVTILTPQTASITTGFNYQCKNVVSNYRSTISDISDKVRAQLRNNPQYESNYFRARAIDKAWEMERIDVEWGGRGSEKWTRAERAEIRKYGRIKQGKVEGKIVKEYPGHHQKSVHYHPEEQGNPDNIKFYRSREEHIKKGHGGDPHNESDQPMLDRAKMVQRTNARRVIKNELKGAGITAIISFATSTTIAFILECARNGWSPEARRLALKTAMYSGGETTGVAMMCYIGARVLVEPATKLIVKVLERAGKNVTEYGREWIGCGIVTAVAIVITGIYTYRKLRKAGFSQKESAIKVLEQSFITLLISAFMFLLNKKLGSNVWTIIIAVVASFGYAGYQYYLTVKDRDLMDKLQAKVIEEIYNRSLSKLVFAN